MTVHDIAQGLLSDLSGYIQKEIRDKNLNATGGAYNSLEVKGLDLWGAEHIYYLVHGRKPGKFPPVDNMRQWVRAKLGLTDDSEVNSVAYLVGKKIAEEGTNIYSGKSKGIDMDKAMEVMDEQFINKLSQHFETFDPDNIEEFISLNFKQFSA